MKLRSLLFVPGDRPDRMEKALSSGADALILDLEDSVRSEGKANAREAVAAFLAKPRSMPLFVRINPQAALTHKDLAAVMPEKPDGIVLPKAEGAGSIIDLVRRLQKHGDEVAKILPIATETPKAMFTLGSYGEVASRLCGLTWGAEDLHSAIGATTARENDGRYTPPYEMARALALFGAHAAGVAAIETVYPALKDEAGLAAYAARGHRDGFAGMLALHPAQVTTINAAFTPTADEINWAQHVVECFVGEHGAIQLDGKMLDAPHLKRARAILASR